MAQGGESFDFAQDREPVERLVEPFVDCYLVLGIFCTQRFNYNLGNLSDLYNAFV
jgi:hypothetical protein